MAGKIWVFENKYFFDISGVDARNGLFVGSDGMYASGADA